MSSNSINHQLLENLIKENSDLKQPYVQLSSDDLLIQLKSIPQTESQLSKLEELKQMNEQINKIKKGCSFSQISRELCTEFLQQIGEGKSAVENAVLRVVNSYARLNAETLQQYEENKLFTILNESGLRNKIREILYSEICNDQNQRKDEDYSIITAQTAQTYAYINKFEYIDQDILISCGKILQFHIKKLIKKIIEQYQINENDDDITDLFSDIINSLQAVYCLSESDNNHALIDDLKMHETIFPLIHINCPDSINCPYRINFPNSRMIHHLQGIVFRAVGGLILVNIDDDGRQNLLDSKQILDHIAPQIIHFALNIPGRTITSFILNSDLFDANQFDEEYSLQLENDGIIYFLQCFIFDNSPACQLVLQFPNLLPSLFQLTRYQRLRTEIIIFDTYTSQIRENSNRCIFTIWDQESQQIKKLIIEKYELIKTQIEGISNCGGMKEENNNVIQTSLYNIQFIYQQFNYGYDQYLLHKDLRKTVDYQIEEGGGIEEIESNLYNSKKFKGFCLRNTTIFTKYQINNYFNVHQNNRIQ